MSLLKTRDVKFIATGMWGQHNNNNNNNFKCAINTTSVLTGLIMQRTYAITVQSFALKINCTAVGTLMKSKVQIFEKM